MSATLAAPRGRLRPEAAASIWGRDAVRRRGIAKSVETWGRLGLGAALRRDSFTAHLRIHASTHLQFWKEVTSSRPDSGLNLRQSAESADEVSLFIPEGWSTDYAEFRRLGGGIPRLRSRSLTQSHGATKVGIRLFFVALRLRVSPLPADSALLPFSSFFRFFRLWRFWSRPEAVLVSLCLRGENPWHIRMSGQTGLPLAPAGAR